MVKKATAAVLSMMILALPFSARAEQPAQKEEVVYVNLSGQGTVEQINVINAFHSVTGGLITDYGDYSDVRNLTNDAPVDSKDGVISIRTSAQNLYYQGTLKSLNIPWRIAVRYYLNGVELAPDEIAGKSGALRLTMEFAKNEAANSSFFDHYALQANVTLETPMCSNIVAEGATQANVGRYKQLSYILLPGKEKQFEIRADVVDFEMDSIAINAVHLKLLVDSGDIDISELSELSGLLRDGTEELTDGARALSGGAAELKNGAGLMADGTDELRSGLRALADGAAELKDGLDKLKSGGPELLGGAALLADAMLAQANAALKNTLGEAAPVLSWQNYQVVLSELAGVTPAARAQAKAQIASATGLNTTALDALIILAGEQLDTGSPNAAECEAAVTQAAAMMASAQSDAPLIGAAQLALASAGSPLGVAEVGLVLNGLIAEPGSGLGTLAEAYAYLSTQLQAASPLALSVDQTALIITMACLDAVANGTPVNTALMTAAASALNAQAVQAAYSLAATQDGSTAVEQFLTLMVIANSGTQMQAAADLLEALSGVESFRSMLLLYTRGVASAAEGAGEVSDGADALLSGSDELYYGSKDLLAGTGALYDGLKQLCDGAAEFKDSLSDLDDDIEQQIDDMLDEWAGAEFSPVSFVSDRNANVGSVQFVMKTAPVRVPEAGAELTEEPEKTTFWQRLLNLFGL